MIAGRLFQPTKPGLQQTDKLYIKDCFRERLLGRSSSQGRQLLGLRIERLEFFKYIESLKTDIQWVSFPQRRTQRLSKAESLTWSKDLTTTLCFALDDADFGICNW